MFDNAWMNKWQKAVNGNDPMSWIGKHFSAEFLFGFGESEYQVSFLKGKIDSFTDEMTPETCYSLAIRGPAESWEKFCQEVPPPMYNDLWAMAHPLHGRVTLEGDQMLLWQNMRALMWALDRMREI
ncbi:MAG: hypothetical protein CBC29_01295 [Methylococcaceae bacterium TMED69]|nr:MAG: hypothetical protein CBC29_01295 [Methylococcaceae bacterium TMED69]|tara:strand:- start:241 stop:618 length:378 start_codon:yes stop_codon:yes gene_type:complete